MKIANWITPQSLRGIAVRAGALLAACLLLGVAVINLHTGVETAMVRAVVLEPSSSLVPWVELITNSGSSLTMLPLGVVLALVLMLRCRWRLAAFTITSMSVVGLLSGWLKVVFERPRPDVDALIDITSYAYPSGHATNSAAMALVLILLAQASSRNTIVIVVPLGWAALVAASRVLLGVHYPTDLLGGWLLAAAWVATSWLMWMQPRRR
jgi:undecaprenyl-diphosphatase